MSLRDQRLDFELEAVFEHQLDFFLPGFLLEPGIAGDLLGPLDVVLVELDLHAGRQLAPVEIDAAQPEELASGMAMRLLRRPG